MDFLQNGRNGSDPDPRREPSHHVIGVAYCLLCQQEHGRVTTYGVYPGEAEQINAVTTALAIFHQTLKGDWHITGYRRLWAMR